MVGYSRYDEIRVVPVSRKNLEVFTVFTVFVHNTVCHAAGRFRGKGLPFESSSKSPICVSIVQIQAAEVLPCFFTYSPTEETSSLRHSQILEVFHNLKIA